MSALLKSLMPRSLFGRAVVITVLPLILVQAIAIFVFYDRVWETVTRRLTHAIAGEIAVAIDALERAGSQAERERFLGLAASRLGMRIEIRAGERIVVSGTFLIDSESRLKAAAAGYASGSPSQ